MQFPRVIRRAFALTTMLSSALTIVLSSETVHAQPVEKFQFSLWKKGLTSPAFTGSYFRVKAERYKQTSDDSRGMGPRFGTTHYDILRSQEYSRITQVGVADKSGVKQIIEQCFTDQYLSVVGNNFNDPLAEPVLKVYGRLDVREERVQPV